MANIITAGVFGAIIGSFLNALSFRYHTGAGMKGRSRCMHCGTTLRARDLVPVASYILLRGRCQECGSRISIQYPLVEAVAALLGAGTYLLHPEPVPLMLSTLVWATMLFAVVYDVRHTVLPASALALLGGLGFISLFAACADSCSAALPGLPALLAGPALGVPLLLLSLVSRGRWMGWGDGVLAIGIGWLLGIPQGIFALLVAFWSGSIVGLVLVAWSKISLRKKAGYTIESAIPFAPFLALGAVIAHVFHIDIFSLFLW